MLFVCAVCVVLFFVVAFWKEEEALFCFLCDFRKK